MFINNLNSFDTLLNRIKNLKSIRTVNINRVNNKNMCVPMYVLHVVRLLLRMCTIVFSFKEFIVIFYKQFLEQ